MNATTMSTAGLLPGAIAEMLLVQAMSASLIGRRGQALLD
jgi:hypothetical protein